MDTGGGTPFMIPWRKTWWGKGLLIILGIVLVLAIIFGALVFNYWRQIKQGKIDILNRQFYGGFTESAKNAQAVREADEKTLLGEQSPQLGPAAAPVIIVEFVDYLCPNSLAEASIIDKVVARYGKKIRVVFRNFPAESIHPGATRLAQIAWCSVEQGRFWRVQNLIYSKQADFGATGVTTETAGQICREAEMDCEKFVKCLAAPASSTKINRDYADGYQLGVAGTPTFFVNGEKVEGVVTEEAWNKYLK